MKTPLFYAFEVSLNYVPESLRFLQAQFHFQSFASLQLENDVVQSSDRPGVTMHPAQPDK